MDTKGKSNLNDKHNAKKQNKSIVQTRIRKPPVQLTPENITKVYEAIKYKGLIKVAEDILGVTAPTINKWRKKYPEFGKCVSHALTEHKELTNREHPEYFTQAMSIIRTMLHDREMVEIQEIEKALFDEDGNQLQIIEKKTVKKTFTREPNWTAVEKVLGRKDLRNVIMGNTQDDVKTRTSIIHQLFGKWMGSDELGARWDGNVFNDMVDLMTIRSLQADTRIAYERGELTIEEYSKLVTEQTKTYGYIVHNRESRALKLLGGKSYSEIIDLFNAQMKNVSNIVEAVCSDINIERKMIPNEIYVRLQNISELRALTAWSDLRQSRPSKAVTN